MNNLCKDCNQPVTNPELLALLPGNPQIRLVCDACAIKYEPKGPLTLPPVKGKQAGDVA